MKFTPLFLLFLLSGCITLHTHNGQTFRNFAPIGDKYQQFVKAGDPSGILPFEGLPPDTDDKKAGTKFRYLQVSDVEKIRQEHPQFLLIFWLPSCSGQTELVKIAKRSDSLNLPVYLVSLTYDLPQINSVTERIGYDKNIIFILPNSMGSKIINKIIYFIKASCKSCYEIFKDEVSGAGGLFIDSGNPSRMLFKIDESEVQNLFQEGKKQASSTELN